MGFDKGRRGDRGGRGRDKFDSFGDSSFGDRDRFAGGGDRFGGGGDRFGGGGGGFRGPGGGGPRPSMPAQVVGEGRGKVKFFNGQKGFGFVSPDDGAADIFVHISAVEQAGLTGLADGQEIAYTMVDRGGRVSATEIKLEGEVLPVTQRSGGDRGDRPDRDRGVGGGRFGDRPPRPAGGGGGGQRQLTGEKATGTVKFFNAMKGFGFVQRDDGQPDVFVHVSAVERAGFSTLNEGDRIGFDIEVDGRGKFAAVNITQGD